jgi:hypothetical protein
VNFGDDKATTAFPPADIADSIAAGRGDDTDFDFRPDFWSIPSEYEASQIVDGSKGDVATCASLLKVLQQH